ncbi:hypothetical protein ACFFX0_23730 [Citricoccus parietis]|uniref:Uncharacterized protein n=1 Tax=Citricoccus parietis TaxID=592307 RepID=A0ABV5G530_9MICC
MPGPGPWAERGDPGQRALSLSRAGRVPARGGSAPSQHRHREPGDSGTEPHAKGTPG